MSAENLFSFSGQMIEWRGPAPYYFVEIPFEVSAQIKALSAQLTYGWGVIPVQGKIGNTEFTTSLIPKNGIYLLPIKNAVRFAQNLEPYQDVVAELNLQENGNS